MVVYERIEFQRMDSLQVLEEEDSLDDEKKDEDGTGNDLYN